MIIFKPGATEIPLGGATVTISSTVWKNPDHYLMNDYTSPITGVLVKNEREIDAYASYYRD